LKNIFAVSDTGGTKAAARPDFPDSGTMSESEKVARTLG
jgi:hypothetical protein